MNLSVVLPCYNEADSLPQIVEQYSKCSLPVTWELILVNNGSNDTTSEVMQKLCRNPAYAFLTIVELSKNHGYGGGILAGLKQAKGEFLAWSHADMQTPPGDVFAAYQKALNCPVPDKTLVKGRRASRPLSEQALTWGMQSIASVCLKRPLTDINAQPKLFHRSLLDKFHNPPEDFNLDLYLYHLAILSGYQVVTIPVVFGKRAHGESRWAFSLRSKAIHIGKTLRFIAHLARRSRATRGTP